MVVKQWMPLGKQVLVFVMALTLAGESYGVGLQVSPQAGVTLDGWAAEITTLSLSPRIVSLRIVPEEVKAVTLTVTATGFDPGEYDLAVSGAPVKRYTADDLAKGVPVLIPEVMGTIAGPAREWADEWVGRLDRAEARVKDMGYGPDDTPQNIKDQANIVRALLPDLEEPAQAKAVLLTIARSESGPIALPALSACSLAEIQQRIQTAREASLKLIHLVANLEDAAVKREIFSELLGNWIARPEGEGVDLALAGQTGTADITLPVRNSPYNPPASLGVKIKPPKGWEPKSEMETTLDLAPGQIKELPFSFNITQATSDQRVGFPVELTIKVDGETVVLKTGAGFGNEFLRSWKVVGPFPLENSWRLDIQLPPEKDATFSPEYETAGGKVSWKEVQAESNGLVDLLKAFPGGTDCAAYATVWVYLPSSQTLQAAVGSDDSIRVWANGQQVFSRATSRAALPNQDTFALPLRMGWNQLLVKVTQGANQWGFFFDIRERAGMTPKGMRISLEPRER